MPGAILPTSRMSTVPYLRVLSQAAHLMHMGLSGSLVASQVGFPFPALTGPPGGEPGGCPDLDSGF